MQQSRSTAGWIEMIIRRFCSESTENSLKNGSRERAWGEPIVGFSKGDDPLYLQISENIGPFYLTPMDPFNRVFPDVKTSPDALTIISWILPQTSETKRDHRKEKIYPPERWARSRLFGENFNSKLRREVVRTLKNSGFNSVAPVDTPFWSWHTSDRYGLCSNWSERHAAYVSGLGTFGLCDGLITPVGKAVRIGTVIAQINVEPTIRPYTDHHQYCLFFTNGKCGKCIRRCPAGAVTEKGHDKVKCHAYLQETLKYVKNSFGIETYACGLCQTGVPCESMIPPDNGKRTTEPVAGRQPEVS
jgi:epoxyqueuosine reductase